MAGPVTVRKKDGQVCQRPATACDITDLQFDDASGPTDLNLLKEVSERLHLATRRPSTVQWKQVIEFRKSMGLYSTEVEPQFLDKIVEAKMKSGTPKTCSPRNSPRIKDKFFSRKENGLEPNKEDEINNNSIIVETSRKSRSKSERSGSDKASGRKNGISLPTFVQVKDKTKTKKSKSKFDKKSDKSLDIPTNGKLVHASVAQETVIPSDDIQAFNHCDATKDEDEMNCEENSASVTRFPLYDTDDEDGDDLVGMSEMAVRHCKITRTLGKIRRDLIIMRMEDNKLARKLLDARSELNLIKVRQSCDEHANMLDDVTYELEEEDFLPGLIKACDLPSRPPGSLLTAFSSLRNIGVSRMNLNRRRFSIR